MSSGSEQDAEARITHLCVEEGDQCEFRWRGCLWNEICEVYLVLRGTLGGKQIVVVPRKCDRTRAPFSATWRDAAALASTGKATTATVSPRVTTTGAEVVETASAVVMASAELGALASVANLATLAVCLFSV